MPQSLEDLLVQTKLISPPQLAVAQRDAEMRRRPLAQTLIDLGFVSDRKFAEWLGGVTKLPVVDPLRFEVVSEFETNMPAAIAREYAAVPLDVNADEMTIATVNPLDTACLDAVHAATGMKIQPVIGILGQIMAMVDRFYSKPPEFDPSATLAVSEVEPFHFGDDTLLRNHSREFAFSRKGDESLGSETRILPLPNVDESAPPPPPAPATAKEPEKQKPAETAAEAQLDRIERHLTDLVRIVEALQRRIEAIDSTLARILNQR